MGTVDQVDDAAFLVALLLIVIDANRCALTLLLSSHVVLYDDILDKLYDINILFGRLFFRLDKKSYLVFQNKHGLLSKVYILLWEE